MAPNYPLTATIALVVYVLLSAQATARADSPIRPGDRVAIVGNTYADQLRIHGYLETLLRLHAGEGEPIAVRNFGWAGDTLTHRDRPTNLPSEESSLKAFGADVIVACFGMGESFAGEAGLSDFRKDLLDFLAAQDGKSYGEDPVRLILVSPIAYEDHGTRTPNWEGRNADLAAYSQVIAGIAAERKLPFVDLHTPSAELMEEEGAPDLTSNGITLNAYGYWALGGAAAGALVDGASGWRLTIHPDAGFASEMKGVKAEPGKAVKGGMNITVTELLPPVLPPPGGSTNPSLRSARDVLTVTGLEAGDHTLSIDGEEILTASADEWATGVVLTNTPAHRELEAYRAAINDKNTQHTYAWKAYNQVHIVGERRSSDAGQALPAELIEFQKLTKEREAALATPPALKTRTWSLTVRP